MGVQEHMIAELASFAGCGAGRRVGHGAAGRRAVTQHPGYASNATAAAVMGQGKTDDFSFAEEEDDREVITCPDGYGTAMVDFFGKDYGGWCRVEVYVTYTDGQSSVEKLVRVLTVPLDSDGDKIADTWALAEQQRWNDQYGTSFPATPRFFSLLPEADFESPDPDGSTNMLGFSAAGATGRHADGKDGVGDGRKLLEEYRGYILDGGGFDWDGNTTFSGGHVRLSPVYKELLVEVDAMAGITYFAPGQPGAAAGLETTLHIWMDAVARGVAQTIDGAGFRMYYVLDQLSTPAVNGWFDTEELQHYLNMRRTISSPIPGATQLQFVKELGWDSGGQSYKERQAVVAVDTLFRYLQNPGNPGPDGLFGTGDDISPPGWFGHHPLFDDFVASYVSHELHHTYAWVDGDDTVLRGRVGEGGGHFNDTNGNLIPDEAADLECLLYDYAFPDPSYSGQDYLHIRYGRGTTQYISISTR
jgi:hypothetical protein